MKNITKFTGVVSVGVSVLVASTALAGGGFGRGRAYYGGGYRGGYGWGWGVPAIAFGLAALSCDYYYNCAPVYYSAPPPYYAAPVDVIYAPPTVVQAPVVYSTPPTVASSQPTTTQVQVAPAPAPSVQYRTTLPNNQQPIMTVADIKALVKDGLGDAVIQSQVRNNQVVFHLTTAEIIDLKTSGVSEKVIDFMINTASTR